MPIHEYECRECGHIEEVITTKVTGDLMEKKYAICSKCAGFCAKIVSAPHFRVTGANAKNGYSSIPTYNDVIDENGRERKQWGKK